MRDTRRPCWPLDLTSKVHRSRRLRHSGRSLLLCSLTARASRPATHEGVLFLVVGASTCRSPAPARFCSEPGCRLVYVGARGVAREARRHRPAGAPADSSRGAASELVAPPGPAQTADHVPPELTHRSSSKGEPVCANVAQPARVESTHSRASAAAAICMVVLPLCATRHV